MKKLLAVSAAVALLAGTASAQAPQFDKIPESVTLFKNVKVFDGKQDKLLDVDVLVVRNKIHKIGKDLPVAGEWELDEKTGGATEVWIGDALSGYSFTTYSDEKVVKKTVKVNVIDGGARTLMPGIIEGHGHIGLPAIPLTDLPANADWQYIGVGSVANAKFFLDSGWTTVRDVGGPSFGIKKAIDEGVVPGPRVYPAGRLIGQTSGHSDVRAGYAAPHPNDSVELPWANREFFAIADGVPEVLRATREELRKGAVHIKVMAGGGIASQYDPIHTTQYSSSELEAIVGAAADWGTYVMVHAYTDESVRRCIEAGVKVIEHGQLMTAATAKLAAKNGVWLSTQIAFLGEEPTPEQIAIFGEVTAAKFRQVRNGVATSIEFAKKYGIKVAFGTDLWGPRLPEITNEFRYRKEYFSNIEILRQATSINGELLQLTGKLNPYPEGPLGVIEEGAYADILLVDGNPIEEIELLMDPGKNLKIIMKDGKIYKNTL